MVEEKKWYECPQCGKKMFQYRRDTLLVKFPAYCKFCKKERIVTIEPKSRIVKSYR